MTKKFNKSYNEMDFIDLLQIIWHEKIKVLLITVTIFLISYGYNYLKPNSYESSIIIKPNHNSKFVKFIPINQYLVNYMTNDEIIDQEIQINATTMRDRFIQEFLDFEEFITIIKKNSDVKKNISQSGMDSQSQIYKYSKLLSVEKLKADTQEFHYILKFKWNNKEEGKKILSDTLNLTLSNLHKSVFNDLENLLKIKRNKIASNDRMRIQFLKEQSAIAKELKIIENQVDSVNLPQEKIAVNITTSNIGYYLQGYKAIDKEISLIENREYIEIQEIREQIQNLKTDDTIKLVKYNEFLIEINSLNNGSDFKILSIIAGLLVGMLIVVASNILRSRELYRKN